MSSFVSALELIITPIVSSLYLWHVAIFVLFYGRCFVRSPRRRSLSSEDIRRDAERLHAFRKSEVLRGVYREPVRISLESFADRYMEYAKTNKRS
jgi:hypothetical protein